MKKKTVKKIIGWVVLALVAAGLAILPTLARQAADQDQASVLTAKAEQGEIEYTLAGGGTLTAEDPIEVKIPATVEVLRYLVENGDRAEKGQALAEVDRVTLMGAINEVQQSLDTLAEQMREEGSSATATTLYTRTAGRVKAIYAGQNDDVRQVMLEHGSLAVISLDGMMVTEIETTLPVAAGTALRLELSDGKAVTGIVKTVMDGKLTVTLSDDGPKLGDTATAYTEDGVMVGTGILRVHSAWDVIAVDGTVSQVYVRENQTVYAGSGILRLNGLSGSAEYQKLAAKRGKYEDLMRDLFALYTDNIVRAPEAGFVSGIDDSKIKNTAFLPSPSGEGANQCVHWLTNEVLPRPQATLQLLANEAGTWLGTVLSVGDDGTLTARVIPYSGELPTDITRLIELSLKLSAGTEMSFSNCELLGAIGPGSTAAIMSDGEKTSVTPVDLVGALSGGGSGRSGGTGGTAGGMTGGGAMTGGSPGGGEMSGGGAVTGGGMTGGEMAAGGAAGGGMAGGGGMSSGGMAISIPTGTGSAAATAQTGEGEEDDGLYEIEEKTILSITPDNAMTVSIDVDELDILQYEIGMQADVTVDALPDHSFTAEVTEISPLGENSGGNSKYQVQLRLDRAPDMLDGMNASVVVHGGSKTALLLPAAAIYDRGSKSYVFTALDSKTGKPMTEHEVTTGLSDGENVEILSGLTENQPVFYEYYVRSGNEEGAEQG